MWRRVGRCPRLRAARPLAALPLQVGTPVGATTSVGSSAIRAAPTSGAAPPGGRPCEGVLPAGVATAGATALRVKRPQALLPYGALTRGRSGHRHLNPRRLYSWVQRPQAPLPVGPAPTGIAIARGRSARVEVATVPARRGLAAHRRPYGCRYRRPAYTQMAALPSATTARAARVAAFFTFASMILTSLGEGDGDQASSSLAVIHTTGMR
ncbi:hypothetical protein C4D60_Mb03t14960 [Musa balbisiana]|uniref:Uncharacterized protein n=1 Tax=Musa balbisiana TaxID=52838 RepID=A0A4S8JA25_MUSBA|nr:hypothetical protein C4D60_Mb03t14960 [Musa balbisiana]